MSINFRCATLALFATASWLPLAAAHAEDADTAETAATDILVIGRSDMGLNLPTQTGSRLGLTPLELPASISTIDGDAIRARGDLTILEAVTRAPGITQAGNAGDGNTALTSRGFTGQGSVLQLMDGVRQFPVAGTITFPTDPWNVERIEVLTGPASVLYGQGALGGAINVVTKKPGTRQSFDVEASYGSQDTMHLAAGAGGPINDVFSYRLDASYRRSDGWVDRGGNNSLALGGSLRYAPTDSFSITARLDYGDVNPMEYWGTPLIDGRLDDRNKRRNYNAADADISFRDDRQTLIIDWSPSETISFQNRAYRLGTKRSWYDLENYCYQGANGDCRNGNNYAGPGTPGTIYRSDNLGIIQDSSQIGNLATLTVKTPLGGTLANDLVVGFDVNRIKLDYSNNFAVAAQEDEVDPFVFNPGTFQNRADTLPRYRTRTDTWSIFAEDRLKLSEQLSIVGGFRYEEDRYKRRTYVYTGGAISGTVNALPGGARQKTFSDFTWRVGAVYQPVPTVSLYGQYSTGVDPVGTLTTFSVNNPIAFAFSNAKGDQIEAGVKASFLDGRGSATLAAYKIVKNDLTTQRTATSPIEQIGRQSSKGIEAAVSLHLSNGFAIEANGTILDAQFDRFLSGGVSLRGNTPQDVPETSGNLWLTWQGTDKLRVQTGLRYVGHRYSDNGNTFRVPSYTVVDGGISYAFTENLAVDARVYNLFDKDYATSTYYPEQWLLGRPRSFDVAVRARF